VPYGTWKYRLTLQSGRITHTATGKLTIAKKPGVSGLLAAFNHLRPTPLILTLAGSVSAVLILLIFAVRPIRAWWQARLD
jgi:hypothetical protein